MHSYGIYAYERALPHAFFFAPPALPPTERGENMTAPERTLADNQFKPLVFQSEKPPRWKVLTLDTACGWQCQDQNQTFEAMQFP